MKTKIDSLEATTKVHPFEQSGHGIAPFHFNNFYLSEKGTSCDHCGAFIKNVFEIGSSDGITFKVGSSCVDKTDHVLYLEVKKARSEYLNQLRRERKEAGLKSWKAEKEARFQMNLLSFSSSKPEIFDFLDKNKDCQGPGCEFITSLYYAVKNYGKLTEKQESAILRMMNPKVSNYVGEIGKKQEFVMTLNKVNCFEGQWGTIYYNIFSDDVGNVIVYKGTASFSMDVELDYGWSMKNCEVGDKVILTAKVKAHTEYKGMKQTIIERFKVKNIMKKGE